MKCAAIAVALLLPLVAHAELFTWDAPTTYADGVTPFPEIEIHEYRLYCDERLVMIVTRRQRVAWAAFQPGTTSACYVTAAAQSGLESAPSNVEVFQSDPNGVPRCFMARSAVTGLMYQHCNLWFE